MDETTTPPIRKAEQEKTSVWTGVLVILVLFLLAVNTYQYFHTKTLEGRTAKVQVGFSNDTTQPTMCVKTDDGRDVCGNIPLNISCIISDHG